MKIIPKYNKKILSEPYFKGFVTGMILSYGFFISLFINLKIGLLLLFLATYMYYIQIRNNKNFIFESSLSRR